MLRKVLLLGLAAIVLCGGSLSDADGGIFRNGLFRKRCQPRCSARSRRQPVCDPCTPCGREMETAKTLCPISRMGVWNNVYYYSCQKCDDCLNATASTSVEHDINGSCPNCYPYTGCTDPITAAFLITPKASATSPRAAGSKRVDSPHPHVFAATLERYVTKDDEYNVTGTNVKEHANEPHIIQKRDSMGKLRKYPVRLVVVRAPTGRPLHVGQQAGPEDPMAEATADVIASHTKARHKIRVRNGAGSLAGKEFFVLMLDEIP